MMKYLRSAQVLLFCFPNSSSLRLQTSFMTLYLRRILLVKWGEQLFIKFNELV